MTTDGHAEGAYNTTIGFIEDVTQLGTEENAARIGGFNSFLDGNDELTDDITPFTSTAADQLRVHSVGVRNAYGVVTDPDGVPYATMNNDQNVPGVGTPSDRFYRLQQFGNYGFRQDFDPDAGPVGSLNDRDGNGNETPFVQLPGVGEDVGEAGFAETQNVTSITAEDTYAGTQYDVNNPNGSLGPSAAVGGVDFNTNNDLLLRWHQDAFIGRWTFQDVVSVDTDTGEVVRIAHGFNRSLEIVRDPFGNILVSETPLGDTERANIHLIQGVRSRAGETHLIEFLNQTDSDWSDRSAWGGDFNDDGSFDAPFLISDDLKLVPHQWGDQQYDVTINRAVANLTITLDQDATINNLLLGNELQLTVGSELTVEDTLAINDFGVLKGNGLVNGNVESAGTLAAGDSVGSIDIVGDLTHSGTLQVEIDAGDSFDQLSVSGVADLSGVIQTLIGTFEPEQGQVFDVLTASSIVDSGLELPASAPFLYSVVTLSETTQALRLIAGDVGVVGDVNGDGDVNELDITAFLPLWRTSDPDGDLNFDGVVDLGDVGVLHQALAVAGVNLSITVPEPPSTVIISAAAFGACALGTAIPPKKCLPSLNGFSNLNQPVTKEIDRDATFHIECRSSISQAHAWFHPCGTAGRDRHHRDLDRLIVAGCASCS